MDSRTEPDRVAFAGSADCDGRARVAVVPIRAACTACGAAHGCVPCQLAPAGRVSMAGTVLRRRRLAAEQVLYAQGDAFENLFAVHCGTLKSTMALADGRVQICGFHMAGEVVAWDGLSQGVHTATVTALDSAQVCVISHACLVAATDVDPVMQRRLNRLMSLEIVRGQRLLMILGVCSARERLAAFLLDLSCRFHSLGYSANDFNLRMTRADIGSHLGMTLETVSRTFSLLCREGLLQIDHRRVRIQDPERLRRDCERPQAACRA